MSVQPVELELECTPLTSLPFAIHRHAPQEEEEDEDDDLVCEEGQEQESGEKEDRTIMRFSETFNEQHGKLSPQANTPDQCKQTDTSTCAIPKLHEQTSFSLPVTINAITDQDPSCKPPNQPPLTTTRIELIGRENVDPESQSIVDQLASSEEPIQSIDSEDTSDEAEEEDDEDDVDEDEDDDDQDDEEDEDEPEGDSDDSSNGDIVDPGQHYHFFDSYNNSMAMEQSVSVAIDEHCDNNIDHNQLIPSNRREILATTATNDSNGDMLDSERMLEVTRKLVRNTERDPDRDLRKQVLLKTAIKKLPHFMEYNRYNDTLDRSFYCNTMSSQSYYEQQDSQPKFYHSVQPNAIQMSTTSLRMLDLNDHDQESNTLEADHQIIAHNQLQNTQQHEPIQATQPLSYNTPTSLEHHDYETNELHTDNQSNLHQSYNYNDRYHHHHNHHHHYQNHQNLNHHRVHDYNQYESGAPLSRYNSLDNLYQPNMNTSDMNDGLKDERISVAFQIACEICDFTCAPDDNEKKIFDNLTNAYYTSKSKEFIPTTEHENLHDIQDSHVDANNRLMTICNEDSIESRDQDNGSDSSSSSHSSSSSTDESINSLIAQSLESDEVNTSSLLEASLNSSYNYYHNSHDSGVGLFSPRSNKRSSSSLGLDYEMDIDHLTELSSKRSIIGTSQYKKLRKRELVD